MTWLLMAVLSAVFAGLTAILAKCGIRKTDSDLATALRLRNYDYGSHDMAIVSKFNNITVSFHVQEVVGIHRVQWEDINRPDNTIDDEHSLATGIVRIDNRLIIILDLEKILFEIILKV